MSEFDDFDLERSSAKAWRSFQARLADHVAAMEDDDVLIVQLSVEIDRQVGAAPYVQLFVERPDWIGCEVVSNHYLAPTHVLSTDDQDALVALGFARPTHAPDQAAGDGSANFHVDLRRTEADRLAVMAVRALRDVFGVPHPAFLRADIVAEDEDVDLGLPAAPTEQVPEVTEQVAVYPHDGEKQLRDLVAMALTPFLGHERSRDEDGDFPLVHGSAVVFVRVLTDVSVVQLFSCVVQSVEDRHRAAREVAVLNRDERLVKFVLVGDSVLAYLHLPAWPFVAEHLRAAVAMLSEVLDRVGGDLASHVDGRLHPAMQTLLELDADQPGSVDPALAAGICEYDRGLILELISWSEQQAAEWSRARAEALEEARNDAAAVCGGQAEQARRTAGLLRRALRITVEAQVAEARRRQGSGRRQASGVSRRAADPSLEEVNPEMWG